MTSTLDFVDSIASSPTTRLNLADGTTWSLAERGTEFPPPPLRRVISSTMIVDGGVIPSSAYDFRVVTLQLILNGATADATATALQALYRELDRPTNLLRWRHETTNPVFFRTYRASADAVAHRPDAAGGGRRKQVTVNLIADPFAYGLREDPIVLATVATDPAAGNVFVDVTSVKGDTETPAYIRWPGASLTAADENMFAVRRRGTPSATPFLFQAEAMTVGTDTVVQGNNVAFSGAGNNYVRTSFTTVATSATRLSMTSVGSPSVDLRGRYRVLLRYRKNTGADVINLRLRWGDALGAVEISNAVFATPADGIFRMADLGEIDVPFGDDPVTDPSGVQLDVNGSMSVLLRAERTSGSGTIDFDYFLLVPADDRFGIVKWADAGPNHWILDAHDSSITARDSSSRTISAGHPALAGGLPMLSPGQTNRIYMIRTARAAGLPLTTIPDVSVSYWPRYLSVRPATT